MNRGRHGAVAALLLTLFGLVGCSLFTPALDEADFGSIQTLGIGDVLVIQLMGNATTGYEWARVHPASLEGTPLDVIHEKDYQPVGCEPIGGSGQYTFRYRAMRLGTVALEFEYRRPWAPLDSIDYYIVTVWVR